MRAAYKARIDMTGEARPRFFARGARARLTMRAWPVARSIFDAPLVREANEGTTSWIRARRVRSCFNVLPCALIR